MHEGKPSTTALYVAIYRAAHQAIDRPLVFSDPLALRILDSTSAADLTRDPHHFETDFSAPFLRAILAARSRIAEDAVAEAVAQGIDQYVILGAGLDTFAYRNPFPALRIFEVDHPATQEWKRGRLEEGNIVEPDNLRFVPIDFTRHSLDGELARAGFVAGRGAVFSWLGVTPYVSKDVVSTTLKYVGGAAGKGGGIVLDYVLPPETQPPIIQAALATRREKMKSIGEPWDSFFHPEEMEALLRAANLAEIDDLGPEELNGRYFANRDDGLQVGPVGRVVKGRTA